MGTVVRLIDYAYHRMVHYPEESLFLQQATSPEDEPYRVRVACASSLRGLHFGQFESRPARPVEQRIGFVIAGERFCLGIPLQAPSQLAGDIQQMADAD